MDRYPPIAEHGPVGDLQTAALVSSRGVVDWFAAPRFDSPSIFAALIDHDGGGYIRPALEHPDATCKQLYHLDTAIPGTRSMSPDEGIRETRDGRQDFTYGHVMSWVAFDQGPSPAGHFRGPADVEKWRGARDTILEQVMERGWSEQEGGFVQHFGGDVLDASLLLMARVESIAPRDPVRLCTLDAVDRELVFDSLVHRYDPAPSPDGLRGSEGTFSLCTFLHVDAPARTVRLARARYTFEKTQTYANHVGLIDKEFGPTGEQLGNFSRAFTRLSLILAATTLDRELDAEQGR
ncbi:glycoside hydrolase family 15 protein [Streptomyces sp. NPDC060000]|uniref:glycoside hydrolase family 15 protein n=1 Tax=Streptomyces sp. NPDC060000 TaxID=3347031 RepID=UPI0036C783E8